MRFLVVEEFSFFLYSWNGIAQRFKMDTTFLFIRAVILLITGMAQLTILGKLHTRLTHSTNISFASKIIRVK